MKKHIYKIGFILIMAFFVSCNDFGDINVDPTKSTNLDPVNQLLDAQMRFSGRYATQLRASMGILLPMLQQVGGTSTNNYGERYAYSESYSRRVWVYDFPELVVNMVDAVERTNGLPERINLNAMCRIMKVIVFARITDLYGDIPYTEAGQGYVSLIIHPKYDDQKDIYYDFFKELKEAHDQLDATKDNITKDQFFAGDVAKWKKLANTLRLRYAMRLIKVDPAKAKAEAEAAYADGVMSSNDDICFTKHENYQSMSTSELRGNGLSAAFLARADGYRVHTTFIDYLKPDNLSDPYDPRLHTLIRSYYPLVPSVAGIKLLDRIDITDQVDAYYASLPDSNALSGIVGLAPGANTLATNDPVLSPITIDVPGLGSKDIEPQDQRRQVANFIYHWDAPAFHVTYAETELLLAEAKVRGWNVGSVDANTHYKNGIRAAIEQLSIYPEAPSITGTDAFVDSKNLETGKELEQINNQLYLALFLNSFEGYANWRRSGYPELLPAGTLGIPIPRRCQYPLNAIEQNQENVELAIAKIKGVAGDGIDSYLNRVWWDKE